MPASIGGRLAADAGAAGAHAHEEQCDEDNSEDDVENGHFAPSYLDGLSNRLRESPRFHHPSGESSTYEALGGPEGGFDGILHDLLRPPVPAENSVAQHVRREPDDVVQLDRNPPLRGGARLR